MSKENAAAAAKQPKAPVSIDPRYVGRIAGILLGICLVTALLLGVVNQITEPKITAMQKTKQEIAMSSVLAADVYTPVEISAPHVNALYEAGSAGWVVEVTSNGSQGAISMMVGVDTGGKVTGVSVVSHSETPNIGSKVVGDQSVLNRFVGMSHDAGEITVNSGANRFDGVTGATVSSKGVTAGVNAALNAVSELLGKEG